MRILLFSNSYLPVLGGLQTLTHNLAERLVKRKHSVLVIANRYPRTLPKMEIIDGVTVRRLLFLNPSFDDVRRHRPDLFLASLWYYPAGLLKLGRVLDRFHPEVVNVHFPSSQIPFVLSLRHRYQFRLVVSLHGNEILQWFDKGGDLLQTNRSSNKLKSLISILQQADAVTACSNYLLNNAIDLAPAITQKGVVIYNGVDFDRFTKNKATLSIQKRYCFAYGRFTHQKGFDLLLNAFSIIASQY